MKNSIFSVCLLIGSILISINAMAERRLVKQVFIPRLQMSLTEQQSLQVPLQRETRKVVMSSDTIDLTESTYNIDDVEAFYYTSGGHAYFSFNIWNYDDEYPHISLDFETTSKTQIQGQHTIDLPFSFLTVNGTDTLDLTKAIFWLKYTGLDGSGDPLYDILVILNASDGKVYKYKANMPVYAYDEDNSYQPIKMTDMIDVEIVEPEIPKEDPATGINPITNYQSPITNKILRDGQLLILRGNCTYTITGQEVK